MNILLTGKVFLLITTIVFMKTTQGNGLSSLQKEFFSKKKRLAVGKDLLQTTKSIFSSLSPSLFFFRNGRTLRDSLNLFFMDKKVSPSREIYALVRASLRGTDPSFPCTRRAPPFLRGRTTPELVHYGVPPLF